MFRIKEFSFLLILILLFNHNTAKAQEGESQLGGWYIYVWNTGFADSSFGLQGDIQHRNFEVFGDFQQLLIRNALTYVPKNTDVKLALGYAYINTGTFGESNAQFWEHRIYQEASLSQKIGSRIYLGHRFRFEQRFIEDTDFVTRYRYMLSGRIPLNKTTLDKDSFYLSVYSELFINGQKDIGSGRTTSLFGVHRGYAGFGYSLSDNLKTELAYMRQTTNDVSKGQLTLSVFHQF